MPAKPTSKYIPPTAGTRTSRTAARVAPPLCCPPLPPAPAIQSDSDRGLLIRFSHAPTSTSSRKNEVERIKRHVYEAVQNGGMESSSGRSSKSSSSLDTAGRKGISRDPSAQVKTSGTSSASNFFKGSYGQLIAALNAGGLTATQCHGPVRDGE